MAEAAEAELVRDPRQLIARIAEALGAPKPQVDAVVVEGEAGLFPEHTPEVKRRRVQIGGELDQGERLGVTAGDQVLGGLARSR